MSVFNSLGSNYSPKHMAHMVLGFDSNARDNLATYLQGRYDQENVTLTYKGREAMYLALKNLDLEDDAQVATNGYTCFAVYDAIVKAGLEPVYVDIAKDELNFSAAELKKVLKKQPKIKVVIIQNTLGTPCDIKAIENVCHEHKLELIEDLAHSIGMHYNDGREAGLVATATLSFSADKVVDAVSGGALVDRSGKNVEVTYRRLRYLRFLKDYYYIMNTMFVRTGYLWGLGIVYHYVLRKLRLLPKPMDGDPANVRKPDNWHASLALKQFADLEDAIQHRQNIAAIYLQNLPDKVKLKHFERATYTRFPIQVEDPAGLVAHLKKKRIYVADIWYEATVSPRRHLSETNYKDGDCPRAEEVASRMVNLPTHINIHEDQAEKITAEVNAWLSNQE